MSVRHELRRQRFVAVVAAIVLVMVGAAALTGTIARELGGALLVVAAAGSVLITISIQRLRDIGREPYGVLWTSVPLVEAAVVPFLPLQGWIPLAVCTCFAVWGATGMNQLLATRKTDLVRNGDEREWIEKKIRRGGDPH